MDKNNEIMNSLTEYFIYPNIEKFKISLKSRLNNNNYQHPRFDCGLLLKDEFDYYITAYEKRTTASDEYLLYAIEYKREYEKYNYINIEPLSSQIKDKIISPNYIDEFGNHSLISAIQTRDIELIEKILITYPKLINQPGKFGDRALDHACILIDYNIVKMLINAGADQNLKSAFNGIPLDWLIASSFNHSELNDEKENIVKILNKFT